MLCRRHRRRPVPDPVHELHDVLVDVLLADAPVGADDVRQDVLAPGRPVCVGEVAPRPVERFAVELQPFNRACGPEVAAHEPLGHTPGGRAVREGEARVAEVNGDQGVVVGVGLDGLAPELAFLDARATHCCHASGRAEDAGQAVQGVHRHVIQGAATRLAVVPRRVDVAQDVVALPHPLLLVVGAEGGATGGPDEGADCAFLDEFANPLVVRADHLAGRCDDAQVLGRRRCDQLIGLVDRRRHRLVEVQVLTGGEGLRPLVVVQADRRRDRDGIDVPVGKHLLVGSEVVGDTELCGSGFGAPRYRVAHRPQADPIVHVLECEVRQDPPHGDAACTRNAHPNHVRHGRASLPAGATPGRREDSTARRQGQPSRRRTTGRTSLGP